MWTVPSCEEHNLGNNLDVEYTRNIICGHLGTNFTAEIVCETAKRSYDQSPPLFGRTFRETRSVLVDGVRTSAFRFDLKRVEKVIAAICHALAYRDFGREYLGDWSIFCANLRSLSPTPEWDRLRATLSGANYDFVMTPHPEVFTYGIHRTAPTGIIYRLIFYGGFIIYAFPILPNGSLNSGSKEYHSENAVIRRAIDSGIEQLDAGLGISGPKHESYYAEEEL